MTSRWLEGDTPRAATILFNKWDARHKYKQATRCHDSHVVSRVCHDLPSLFGHSSVTLSHVRSRVYFLENKGYTREITLLKTRILCPSLRTHLSVYGRCHCCITPIVLYALLRENRPLSGHYYHPHHYHVVPTRPKMSQLLLMTKFAMTKSTRTR